MPKSLSNSGVWPFFIIPSFVAGLFLCKLQSLKFVPEITLGQVLQTATLLLIFVTAQRYYQKAHDRRRKRIEILVNVIDDILTRVDKCHAVFLEGADGESVSEVMRFRIDSALREYSNAVKGLEDVLAQSGHLEEVSSLVNVKDDRAAYKDLVTETPYPNELPPSRIAIESKRHSTIRSNLVGLQLEIAELG